jgi:alpha-amylase
MQWAYYSSLRKLEPLVKESGDKTFLRMWRYFQISDHLYYMFTAGGAPGEVHSYFSSFNTPMDAFVTAQSAILDFENRVRLAVVTANEPFLFHTGEGEEHYTGTMALSLKGLGQTLKKINLKPVEFHNARGDFEKWAEKSLRDKALAARLKKVRLSKLNGERLRKALAEAVTERFGELSAQAEAATGYF